MSYYNHYDEDMHKALVERWQAQRATVMPSPTNIIPMKDPPRSEDILFATVDVLVLQQAGLITKKEMINLHKMIRSNDQENLVVAQEIIRQKIDNFKDEE